MDRRFLPDDELERFVTKVQSLKAEGLTVSDIGRRLGIHRNTVNQRLRMWRNKQNQTHWR